MNNYLLTFLSLLISINVSAQLNQVNYDENEVPEYKLPELLISKSGRKIKNTKRWEKIRRTEILKLFQQEIYGKVPQTIRISDVNVHEETTDVFDGLATRTQVELVFRKDDQELGVNVLLYLPKDTAKVPVFVGYNFKGNHAINDDPNILLTDSWVPDNPSLGIVHNQVTEQSRGVSGERWPIEEILKSGYGIVTAYYGDVDPDRDNFQDGIHPFTYRLGQFRPGNDEWGAVSAWAWGLSRIMDYLETVPAIDSSKVVVFGHSRLGKTALWAAANDQRFAMCISNNSGCLGAALSRRQFGETIGKITSTFPHWFCENLNKYSAREELLPVDQHMLLGLIAPRPLYVTSATADLWADPKGEFLSASEAGKVYALYEKEGLPVAAMPEPNSPVMGTIGYHIRKGKHNITAYDWKQFIRFAQKHFEPVVPTE